MADINISFVIRDAQVPDMIAAFGQHYQSEIPNPDYDPKNPDSPEMIDNPQSKPAFAKKEFRQAAIKVWRNKVIRYRTKIKYAQIDRDFEIE